jgi:hypothetical protein
MATAAVPAVTMQHIAAVMPKQSMYSGRHWSTDNRAGAKSMNGAGAARSAVTLSRAGQPKEQDDSKSEYKLHAIKQDDMQGAARKQGYKALLASQTC